VLLLLLPGLFDRATGQEEPKVVNYSALLTTLVYKGGEEKKKKKGIA